MIIDVKGHSAELINARARLKAVLIGVIQRRAELSQARARLKTVLDGVKEQRRAELSQARARLKATLIGVKEKAAQRQKDVAEARKKVAEIIRCVAESLSTEESKSKGTTTAMEIGYTESVGYRPNVRRKKASYKNGAVTVYAERRNNRAALGEYGGDAYPAVFEQTEGNYTYGMIVAADGVGQAAYPHPSLAKYLSEKIASFCADEDNDEAKLSLFLRTLYGEELFEQEDALAYALKSFSPILVDGFYVSDKNVWDKTGADNAQKVIPFYDRESQWLGSRIICVGLYLKFRKYFTGKNIGAITDKAANELKTKIEKYIYGELKQNVLSMINHDDAPTSDKRARYFLSSTVAMWFYVSDDKDGVVNALALNMGDARCYISDTEDGVRQISVDDAFSDGTMSAFVHFGETPKTGDGYNDGTFMARLVTLEAPCALIACSDGVYDTCPEVKKRGGDEQPLGGSAGGAIDFLFEKNLLDAMRRSYSFDDLTREIVYNFYAHEKSAKGIAERRDGVYYPYIKRDDSGTLGAKFFGNTPLELFSELRKNANTSLDALYNKVLELKKVLVNIPISAHGANSAEQQKEIKLEELAKKLFTNEFVNLLKNELYLPAFEDMKKAGSSTLWGITVTDEKPAAGYMLGKFFKTIPNKVAILKVVVADYKKLKEVTDLHVAWQQGFKHEHIIINKSAYECLKQLVVADILKAYDEATTVAADNTAAEMYECFDKCFMGEIGKRDTVDKVGSRAPATTLDKYAKPVKQPVAAEKTVAPESTAALTLTVTLDKPVVSKRAEAKPITAEPTAIDDRFAELADKLFTDEFTNLIKNELYVLAFEDMKKAGSRTLWGIRVEDEKPLTGYMHSKFFKVISNKIAILKTVVADWRAIEKSFTDYLYGTVGHKHEHVIVDDKTLVQLKNAGFADIARAAEKIEREGE